MCFKKIDEAKNDENSTHCCKCETLHCGIQTVFKLKLFAFFSVDQQLIVAMSDIFMPALVANSIQLQFILQRFYFQPEILQKCQNEIDRVVGQSRLPTLDDRQKYVTFHG